MRISDWSSDVCSSDLSLATSGTRRRARHPGHPLPSAQTRFRAGSRKSSIAVSGHRANNQPATYRSSCWHGDSVAAIRAAPASRLLRSEEHTSELQSLMRTSYAVFCLKKKTNYTTPIHSHDREQETLVHTLK